MLNRYYTDILFADKRSQQLKPVLTKVPIVSLGEITPADHILIGSEHILVRAIDVQHDIVKYYATDAEKQLTCTSKTDLIGGKKQCYRIDYDSKSCLYSDDQVLRFAEDECLRK